MLTFCYGTSFDVVAPVNMLRDCTNKHDKFGLLGRLGDIAHVLLFTLCTDIFRHEFKSYADHV